MRKLLYLFLTCLLLAGCRGNRFYLDKVETLWGVDYDSVQYYLLKVDSTSLAPEERLDYHFFRMRLSYSYLMSMDKKQAESIIHVFKQRYPMGHRRAFDCRLLEIAYRYYRLNECREVDSLVNDLKPYMQTRRDSSRWYNNKYQVKWKMDEKDSALHYIKEAMNLGLWKSSYAHIQQAFVHRMKEQPDSAIASYLEAMEQDTTRQLFALNGQILDLLIELKDVRMALEYLEKVRKRMKRADIPYYHLVRGDYWMEMHEPDSAIKHYRIATETGNAFMASQAYERMGEIAKVRHSDEEAFRMYHNAQRVWNEICYSWNHENSTHDFEALKLKNQLNELKVERQSHVILIMGLGLFIVVLISGFAFFLIHRKRINERKQLMQENRILKQQEELSTLREKEALHREKDARMREELFKRMKVFEKLSGAEQEKHIKLTDTDWKEIRLMVDSSYNDFARKLHEGYPDLSEKDINFCCLVKINMSIQSLTDIYCISKNSVSRRKLRLKEKLGIDKDDSLTRFLEQFG